MCSRDLPDMHAPNPRAPGIYIRQIPHAHVTTITCYTCMQGFDTYKQKFLQLLLGCFDLGLVDTILQSSKLLIILQQPILSCLVFAHTVSGSCGCCKIAYSNSKICITAVAAIASNNIKYNILIADTHAHTFTHTGSNLQQQQHCIVTAVYYTMVVLTFTSSNIAYNNRCMHTFTHTSSNMQWQQHCIAAAVQYTKAMVSFTSSNVMYNNSISPSSTYQLVSLFITINQQKSCFFTITLAGVKYKVPLTIILLMEQLLIYRVYHVFINTLSCNSQFMICNGILMQTCI